MSFQSLPGVVGLGATQATSRKASLCPIQQGQPLPWPQQGLPQGHGGDHGLAPKGKRCPHFPPLSPLFLVVAEEGAVVRSIGVVEEGEEEVLPELQGEGELAAQLPHAVKKKEKKRCLLLQPGMGVGRAGAAEVEGMAGLWDPGGGIMGVKGLPNQAGVPRPLRIAGLTSIHSRSSSPWKPTSVRQDGSRITWASAVTSSVVSVPSAPCTSTLASSLRASTSGRGDA